MESLSNQPIWLSEVGLGLGAAKGTYLGRKREWLYWYDQAGQRLLAPEEKVQQVEADAQKAQDQLEKLTAKLKQLGIQPETV